MPSWVLVGEEALRERGERDRAHPLLAERPGEAVLDPPVEDRVRRLVDDQRRAERAGDRLRLDSALGAVRGDADVEIP